MVKMRRPLDPSIMKIAVLDAVRWSNSRHKSGIDLDHS